MTGDEVKVLETVAGLLALYGVFGLVPLSAFLMYSNLKAYQTSTKETRLHCAVVHWVFVCATVALMVAAGLFHYSLTKQRPVLWGSVSGLTDQDGSSQPAGTVLRQELFALGLEDQFYQTARTPEKGSKGSGRYRLYWAVPADPGLSSLVLRVHQHLTRPPRDAELAEPLASPGSAAARAWEEIIREKDFRLDLDSLPQFKKQMIKLTYSLPQGAPAESIGVLRLITNKGPLSLPTADLAISPGGSRGSTILGDLLQGLVSEVAAQSADTSEVSSRFIEADSVAGKTIAKALHSSDMSAQASARDTLVAGGSSSCAFITSELKKVQLQRPGERGLAIHNLAKSIEEIERNTPGACRAGYLPLAEAYYEVKDFASAVKYFDKAPDPDAANPGSLYYRGYAYYRAGNRDSDAIRSLTRYVATTDSPVGKVKAHLLLGRLNHRARAPTEAISHFRAAISTPEAPRWSRAMAANEMAYLYSQEFSTNRDSLRVALPLVEAALAYNPNNAQFLDTKGWILYRLGQCAEAETLLQRAAGLAPGIQVIQDHLKEVKSPRRRGCQ